MRRTLVLLIALAISLPVFSAELHVATPVEQLKPHIVFKDYQPAAPDGFNAAIAREFNVNASQWFFAFDPQPVVNQGDTVTIRITASDVTHGFFLENYMNTGLTLTRNQTRTVSFIANTPGTFTYFCTFECGNGHGGMNGRFTVNAVQTAAPTITGFTPASGPIAGGNAVVINGTGFQTNATVKFGNVDGIGVAVESETRLTVFAPAQAAGAVNITVRNPDGQTATSSTQYTYQAPVVTPTIASFTPATGPTNGGNAVVITGTNFVQGATVLFGDVAAQPVIFTSSTRLTAFVPAHASGSTTITVRNPDGQSVTSTAQYTFAGTADQPKRRRSVVKR